MPRVEWSFSSCDELLGFSYGRDTKKRPPFPLLKPFVTTRRTIKMIGKATANIIDVIAVVKSIRLVGGGSPLKAKRARRGRAFDRMPRGVIMTTCLALQRCALFSERPNVFVFYFAGDCILTVSDTKKSPTSSKNRGCFREKWGGFLGKGVGFKPNSKRIAAELFRERPLLTSWGFHKAKSS